MGNTWTSKLQVSLLRVWDEMCLWARSEKREKSSYSPGRKFAGLMMERGISQEINVHLLYIKHLWKINHSVKFHSPEGK